jgi:hypothetical protein
MKFVFKNIEAAQYLASKQGVEVAQRDNEYEVELAEIGKPVESSETLKQELEIYTRDLYSMISNLRESMYKEMRYLEDRMYEHQQGHLPKVQSVQQLKNVIKILELDEEYEVEKRRIYSY